MLRKTVFLITLLYFNFGIFAQVKHLKIRKEQEALSNFNQIFFSRNAENPVQLGTKEWVDIIADNLYVYSLPDFPLRLGTSYFQNKQIIKSMETPTHIVTMTGRMGKSSDFELAIRVFQADTFLFKQIKLQYLIIPLLYELNEEQDKFKVKDYPLALYIKSDLMLRIPDKVLLTSLQQQDYELYLIEIDENSFYKINELQVIQKRNDSIIKQVKIKGSKIQFKNFELQKGDIFSIKANKADLIDNLKNILQKNIKTDNIKLKFEVI